MGAEELTVEHPMDRRGSSLHVRYSDHTKLSYLAHWVSSPDPTIAPVFSACYRMDRLHRNLFNLANFLWGNHPLRTKIIFLNCNLLRNCSTLSRHVARCGHYKIPTPRMYGYYNIPTRWCATQIELWGSKTAAKSFYGELHYQSYISHKATR